MNNVLSTAVKANVPGADQNSIVVAPEFFSTIFNSGVGKFISGTDEPIADLDKLAIL